MPGLLRAKRRLRGAVVREPRAAQRDRGAHRAHPGKKTPARGRDTDLRVSSGNRARCARLRRPGRCGGGRGHDVSLRAALPAVRRRRSALDPHGRRRYEHRRPRAAAAPAGRATRAPEDGVPGPDVPVPNRHGTVRGAARALGAAGAAARLHDPRGRRLQRPALRGHAPALAPQPRRQRPRDPGRDLQQDVAPGLRLGWMAGEAKAIGAIASVREDLGVSQWMSRLMLEFLNEGLLEPHLARVNPPYQAKRDAAIAGLPPIRDELVKFQTPRGSFYLWIEIDDRVDWERAAAEAARAKIYFRPGERFSLEEDPRQFFRMSYSQAPLETVSRGAQRLGEIIRSSVRGK